MAQVGSHALDCLDFILGPLTDVRGPAPPGPTATHKPPRLPTRGELSTTWAPQVCGVARGAPGAAESRVSASFGVAGGGVGSAVWDFDAPAHAAAQDDLEILGSVGRLRVPGKDSNCSSE